MTKTCLNYVTKAMFVERTQRNLKIETQKLRFSNQNQNGQTNGIDMLEIM